MVCATKPTQISNKAISNIAEDKIECIAHETIHILKDDHSGSPTTSNLNLNQIIYPKPETEEHHRKLALSSSAAVSKPISVDNS